MTYDHKEIEKKWQEKWKGEELYKTNIHSEKPKAYILDMFPYPSGEGLHVGHPKGYIATDVYSRFKKMSGFEVLHPMGWDAFGLPAENFAIKNKVHPREAVEKNIASFKGQLENLGFNYDWNNEINTTDPKYYKWTQWIFLQLFKKGLAYESHEPINWCPSCQTGLANEDLESDGTCERCDSKVEKRPMRQWILKITDYADRLLEDLELLPQWPGHIKEAQRNWIGKSEGAELEFEIKNSNKKIPVFTTRPDTLFGATYMVLAPEHDLVHELEDSIENMDEVRKYIEDAQNKSEMDRLDATKEKTGVELKGIKALNPGNKEEIPVFIADYVLTHYGTGAIMAVPAHDERDWDFAKKFNLPVRQAFMPECPGEATSAGAIIKNRKGEYLFELKPSTHIKNPNGIALFGGLIDKDENVLECLERELEEELGVVLTDQEISIRFLAWENSLEKPGAYHARFLIENFDDTNIHLSNESEDIIRVQNLGEILDRATPVGHGPKFAIHSIEARPYSGEGDLLNSDNFSGMSTRQARDAIMEAIGGKKTNTYRLNDWVFSRQRYWGEPIPIIHCEKCGPVAVPEDQLPVELPEVENYEPTGTGESPLASIDEWVHTTCPECDGPGRRETNTMPQWAGSSWYYLRFIDAHNEKHFIDPELEKKWMPVDVYVGGDHAVRHLIYARFWHKFLFDIGMVTTKEPFERLEFLGFILAEDGRKMSKRWGNIINPDTVVETNGADALRVYEMFMSPFENTTAWSTDGLVGAQRFLERVWRLAESINGAGSETTTRELHKTIRKVGSDIEEFKFNTAIAQMMTFVNTATQHGLTDNDYKVFIQLLAPFAPHLTEEIWHTALGSTASVHTSAWPAYDAEMLVEETATFAVQINGKVRGTVEMHTSATKEEVLEAVQEDAKLAGKLHGEIRNIVFVPGKLINLVLAT